VEEDKQEDIQELNNAEIFQLTSKETGVYLSLCVSVRTRTSTAYKIDTSNRHNVQ
jgi:hypothetical protein